MYLTTGILSRNEFYLHFSKNDSFDRIYHILLIGWCRRDIIKNTKKLLIFVQLKKR